MSQPYVKPLLLVAMLLSGCASAPVDNTVVPTSDTPTKPVPPVKDAEGKHQYVLALMAKEEWHKAAEELELLTGARPKLAGPWVNLGIVRTMLGDSAAAELAFRRAVDADAGHAEAWNQLGMLYRRTGRLEEAEQQFLMGLKVRLPHNLSQMSSRIRGESKSRCRWCRRIRH